jgi:hypothetical protein
MLDFVLLLGLLQEDGSFLFILLGHHGHLLINLLCNGVLLLLLFLLEEIYRFSGTFSVFFILLSRRGNHHRIRDGTLLVLYTFLLRL